MKMRFKESSPSKHNQFEDLSLSPQQIWPIKIGVKFSHCPKTPNLWSRKSITLKADSRPPSCNCPDQNQELFLSLALSSPVPSEVLQTNIKYVLDLNFLALIITSITWNCKGGKGLITCSASNTLATGGKIQCFSHSHLWYMEVILANINRCLLRNKLM